MLSLQILLWQALYIHISCSQEDFLVHTQLFFIMFLFLSCILLEYGIKETKIPSVLFNNWHTFSDKEKVTTLGLMDHRVFVTSTKNHFCSKRQPQTKTQTNGHSNILSNIHTNRQQKGFGKLIIVCQL